MADLVAAIEEARVRDGVIQEWPQQVGSHSFGGFIGHFDPWNIQTQARPTSKHTDTHQLSQTLNQQKPYKKCFSLSSPTNTCTYRQTWTQAHTRIHTSFITHRDRHRYNHTHATTFKLFKLKWDHSTSLTWLSCQQSAILLNPLDWMSITMTRMFTAKIPARSYSWEKKLKQDILQEDIEHTHQTEWPCSD